MSKNTRTRILLTAVAALLLVVMTVGGTLAWLTDVTPPVTNTFSPSDVHISLTETMNTDTNNDNVNDSWTAQLIPGKEYAKNPTVAVDDALTNVDLWVFVKVEDTNASTYLDYSIITGEGAWTELQAGVYYREWTDGDTSDWAILTGNKVTVKSALTADDLYAATAELKFTAYAIQKEGFDTASAAWTEVSKITAATADNNLDSDAEGQAHAALTDPDHSDYEVE